MKCGLAHVKIWALVMTFFQYRCEKFNESVARRRGRQNEKLPSRNHNERLGRVIYMFPVNTSRGVKTKSSEASYLRLHSSANKLCY
jgi:hypothetical protein